ncbi:restriction endonuclease subunit S [Azovibrio restrictus]|uniref:restriction endonuclease subunit S n=1 Tax=Azovibrio restrictus TaxID=146938 RepID=UPI0026EB9E18|nr:restriction endonuclease subunit S [Azovibrio restrictus]MDD3483855.1 restriction endonuclease subunit S [Azovibrio restrictus]
MSRYKAYPVYRDSGVEWLGMVPSHWITCRIKNTATVNPAKSEVREMAPDTEVAFIPMEAIGENGELDTSRTKPLSEVISGYSYVADGDIMIAKITPCFENGKGAIARNLANGIGFATTEVINVRPNNPKDSAYLLYLLSTNPFRKLAEGAMYGAGGQKRVADSFVAEYHLSLPEFSERTKIAAFLDHETAKIDALIEKQQRLIELLKEKRQAVISHAVTKGLNPNAPMKDSGVEWVDAVPAHWRISKLSYHARISNGATPSRDNMLFWENGTIGWLNSSKVNDEVIEEADQFITELALSKTSVKPVTKGDLVMAITGEGQTRGRVAICNIEATINQHLASISVCDKLLNHQFLYLWLEGNYERIRYESEGAGSTKGAITCSEIGAFPVILPPLEEQGKIVCYVTERKQKFDGLVHKAISAIELMQERRTALISAAVTGKIDVRDWQPAAA